jgi:hypothetical protein
VIVPIILIVFFNSVVIFPSAISQVTLIDSLGTGINACPGEIVTFTCTVNGSRILSWNSNEYIGGSRSGLQLEFSTLDKVGLRINSSISQDTYATLEKVVNSNGISSLQSTLHIVTNQSSIISCLSVNNSTMKSINFKVLDGTLYYTML